LKRLIEHAHPKLWGIGHGANLINVISKFCDDFLAKLSAVSKGLAVPVTKFIVAVVGRVEFPAILLVARLPARFLPFPFISIFNIFKTLAVSLIGAMPRLGRRQRNHPAATSIVPIRPILGVAVFLVVFLVCFLAESEPILVIAPPFTFPIV
jgi:hypothetical protein